MHTRSRDRLDERTWRLITRQVEAAFTQHDDTLALDASVLLLPMMEFLPPNDPRIKGTVLAIADELTEDGFVLRYRVEETDDGLSGEEGTFTICSFWLVSPLLDVGELGRAVSFVRSCSRLPARLSST